jgi:hypothetical protein
MERTGYGPAHARAQPERPRHDRGRRARRQQRVESAAQFVTFRRVDSVRLTTRGVTLAISGNKKGPATNGGAFKSRKLFVSEGNEWVSLSTPDDLRLVIFSHSFVFSGRAVARTNDLRQAREQAASRFRAECERTNAAAVPSSAPEQVW